MKYSEFMHLASCLTAADMQARFAYRTKSVRGLMRWLP